MKRELLILVIKVNAVFIVRHLQAYYPRFQSIKKKSKINELCDDAKSFFDGNSDIIKKKWKLMQKLFKSKNKARKECILLPFKTVQKIVSD